MLFNRNITEYKATEHFAGEKELKRHSSDSCFSFFAGSPANIQLPLISYQAVTLLGQSKALRIADLGILRNLHHFPESTAKKRPLLTQSYLPRFYPNLSPNRG